MTIMDGPVQMSTGHCGTTQTQRKHTLMRDAVQASFQALARSMGFRGKALWALGLAAMPLLPSSPILKPDVSPRDPGSRTGFRVAHPPASSEKAMPENTKQDQSFTIAFTVDQTPEQVFAAINNPRGWWSEGIEGTTDKVDAEFTYRYKDVHRCTMKIMELIPNQKVVWRVLENHFNFTKDDTEWTGTTIVFEISKTGAKTEVHFTHLGLVPAYECYAVCLDGWTTYINGSLRELISTGKGKPNVGKAITVGERTLGK